MKRTKDQQSVDARARQRSVTCKRAQSEGYRSRAAYKLLEIAERDKLLQARA